VTRHTSGRHRPRKRFGQHFLAREWAQKLIAAIAPAPEDTFLEIGPGEGAITRQLAARARAVVAIEVDRDLVARLSADGIAGLTVVEGDVLAIDFAALGLPPGTRIAGNLPYNISSPILSRCSRRRAGRAFSRTRRSCCRRRSPIAWSPVRARRTMAS
jgi:16S rRNA (adenine1518-N6/adenine1519-N6)-dimethyltransferase